MFFIFFACFKKSLYCAEKLSQGGKLTIGMFFTKIYIPKDVYVCVRIALDGINL